MNAEILYFRPQAAESPDRIRGNLVEEQGRDRAQSGKKTNGAFRRNKVNTMTVDESGRQSGEQGGHVTHHELDARLQFMGERIERRHAELRSDIQALASDLRNQITALAADIKADARIAARESEETRSKI